MESSLIEKISSMKSREINENRFKNVLLLSKQLNCCVVFIHNFSVLTTSLLCFRVFS